MSIHDWERYGEEIRRTIQDAVENGRYDRLNQSIKNTVNQATDWVARNVGDRNTAYNYQKYQEQPKRDIPKQAPVLFEKKPHSKVGGIFLAIFGFGIGAVSVIALIVLLVLKLLLSVFGLKFWGLLVLDLIVMSGCAIMAGRGVTMLKNMKRFKTYCKVIGKREYCNIEELAAEIGKSNKFVVKDVQKMIKKRWFLQGHLDKDKTCLIVSHQMYEQYKQLEVRKEQQRMEEEERIRKQQEVKQSQEVYRKGLSLEVQKAIEQGETYVQKIRECNEAIPGVEISAKISRMELLVDKIFDRVEQNPESVTDIRKLMEYYLPTAIKLLEAYEEMDSQPVGGENVQNAKSEIEETLDTLNVAFEKLLDSLFQDKAWDVSSDISVLNMMLAQEGLKEDGLKK